MAAKIVSPRAELAVLRAMTHKNKRIAGLILSSVDETYFDGSEATELFEAIKRYRTTTGESPTYRLMLEDPDLSEEARDYFRNSEATVQSVEEAQKAVSILGKYRKSRGLYEIAVAIDQAMKSNFNAEKTMEDVTKRLTALRNQRANKEEIVHFGKNNSSMELVKDLLYNDEVDDTIPTGIEPFDKESGGLMRGSLVTLGASSGGGKSLMATQLAINMATAGYKVLLLPLEMTKVEMTARLIANVAKMDVTRILQKKLATGERDLAFKRYRIWAKKVARHGGRITVYKPEAGVTVDEALAAASTYDADVRIIDYIGLLNGIDGDDQWQKLGAAARVAKLNADATKTVNILLCQVSEDGKIRYARAISEHSNNSWIWVVGKEEREKEVGRIQIDQPKARNSRAFRFEQGFNWGQMKVVSVEEVSSSVGDVADTPMENLADI